MKKIISALLVLGLLLCGVNVFSSCATSDCFIYRLNTDDKTLSIVGVQNVTDTKLVIPSKYKGKSVTNIAERAFVNCTFFRSVKISRGITSIGSSAFAGCPRLESITIPNSVTRIGDGAFANCPGLTSITIPHSVTSISDSVFADCYNLTSVTIPDSITIIGEDAFARCYDLTSITFKGTVAQWNAITKGSRWDISTGDYTIYCTNGTIAKDGTVKIN